MTREPFALETSVPGVFAAGDVRLDSMKRVASAVGEGAMSVYLVHRYLADLIDALMEIADLQASGGVVRGGGRGLAQRRVKFIRGSARTWPATGRRRALRAG